MISGSFRIRGIPCNLWVLGICRLVLRVQARRFEGFAGLPTERLASLGGFSKLSLQSSLGSTHGGCLGFNTSGQGSLGMRFRVQGCFHFVDLPTNYL